MPGTTTTRQQRSSPFSEVVSSLPGIRPFRFLRSLYWSRVLQSSGANLDISQFTIFEFPENVSVGRNLYINRGTLITARTSISIGDDCLIGPYVIINSGDHKFDSRRDLISDQGHRSAPISIGNDVWVGAHASILKGVTIGNGAVVAAGAVVTSDVAPFTVVAGTPAKFIKQRGRAEAA
ncbi:acetyltransferase [Rathayibacter sp. VKM Ac-2803]|uniref:acyltransferase n=1 Tax=Rathayibacter sp. VKM Ac-2803 TaxID=2609256 RepID=UPI00135A4BD7|nr:acetyltransferase [Rathayibacter sp. VKM Ac-2803]